MPEQYELISALAGRTLKDEDGRLSLFAVGDDDQNIYAFAGARSSTCAASKRTTRRSRSYLIENYRSTAHIIAAANVVISPAHERMKADHPITIDRVRIESRRGRRLGEHRPVSKGRVQVLPAGRDR